MDFFAIYFIIEYLYDATKSIWLTSLHEISRCEQLHKTSLRKKNYTRLGEFEVERKASLTFSEYHDDGMLVRMVGNNGK